jgi:predicted dehydrogenase
MKRVRVGVVGVGTMGQRHCRVYSSMRRVELVGVADQNRAAGTKAAANYDTTYFESYDELLENVDAVTITPAHYDLARRALERGVNVLVEKPITETVAQGRELVELAKRQGLLLQVGHIERFNPTYLELKKIIGDVPIVSINMRRLSPFDFSKTDVDVIRDLMIHDLDLLTDLLGREFDIAVALGRATCTDAVDHATACFSFRSGPVATLTASRITEQKVRMIEVIADGAYIEADLLGKGLVIHRHTLSRYIDNHTASTYRQESVLERIHVPMMEPLVLELDHFVHCVNTGTPTNVPGSDGLFALELAHTLIRQVCSSEQTESHGLARIPTMAPELA